MAVGFSNLLMLMVVLSKPVSNIVTFVIEALTKQL